MVRERQPPRMPGRNTQAPIVISDDEGDSVYEISSSPMPRADQIRRLDTSSSQPAKSRLQQEVDIDSSSSDSDVDDSSIVSSKAEEPPQRKQEEKPQARSDNILKDGSQKHQDDDGLEKFMEGLKLAPKGSSNDTQKAECQQKPHVFEARTPGPKPPMSHQLKDDAQSRNIQLDTQKKKGFYAFSGYSSATNPFFIPKKKNVHHPDQQRPDPRTQDQPKFGQVSNLQSPLVNHRIDHFKPKPTYGPPQTPGPAPKRQDQGAFSIIRPTNKAMTTPAAPPAIFSSKPTIKKPVSNIDMFTRLTNSRYEKPVTYKSDEFDSDSDENDQNDPIGNTDVYTYVDPEKANENLKALLEGALEDEEDKRPRTRSRKKKADKKADKAVDDLAEQLETVKVASRRMQFEPGTEEIWSDVEALAALAFGGGACVWEAEELDGWGEAARDPL
ncbi:hypothetical protein KEM56_004224 [Ascosphaera pollenicola]|nr:hypothetical protein KEM56_004224 [Ascosphaera pollenicola]